MRRLKRHQEPVIEFMGASRRIHEFFKSINDFSGGLDHPSVISWWNSSAAQEVVREIEHQLDGQMGRNWQGLEEKADPLLTELDAASKLLARSTSTLRLAQSIAGSVAQAKGTAD
jgi:hypothetical protein